MHCKYGKHDLIITVQKYTGNLILLFNSAVYWSPDPVIQQRSILVIRTCYSTAQYTGNLILLFNSAVYW
jgi:hypothetical protein